MEGLGGGGQRGGGRMGTERDLARGSGHTMQCVDDVSLSCTLCNLYGFMSQCHPKKFT